MESNETRVKNYISHNKNTPLHFSGVNSFNDGTTEIPDKGTLKDLVYQIVLTSHKSCSLDVKNVLETTMNRSRSCIDIWRHVLTYRPKTNIFQVMRALYTLSLKDHVLVGQYCGTVERRVFRAKSLFPSWGLLHQAVWDEFDLNINQWADIGLKHKKVEEV